MSSLPTKGAEIRFVKGTYKGRHGWLDSSRIKCKTSPYRHVIVASKDPNERDLVTRVKECSYRMPFWAPTSYKEAALQQHPDIETAMIQLAKMFIEIGINDTDGAHRLFDAELFKQFNLAKEKQSRVRFRHVEWPMPAGRQPSDDSLWWFPIYYILQNSRIQKTKC